MTIPRAGADPSEHRSRRASRRRPAADARYSQSLERGLSILRCFSPERSQLGIAQIADLLGMRRSTTHRYVITLLALGYLEQDASRRYKLGPGVSDLGTAAVGASHLHTAARPFLEDLRAASSCTAAVAVIEDDDTVWLDVAPGAPLQRSPGITLLQPGSRMPFHCTAEGKAIIAHAPADRQASLLSTAKLTMHGPNTITNKRTLARQLKEIRAAGFAFADEEQAPAVLATAAPVRGPSGETLGAISLTAASSTTTLGDRMESLSASVIASADELSQQLAYRHAE